MKKIILFLLMFLVLINVNITHCVDGEIEEPFVIYTEQGDYLFEKDEVNVFDNYISNDFKMYEIVKLDFGTNTGVARFVKDISRPKVYINEFSSITDTEKKIGVYMTHNAESYVPTDGYDSVYGEGGIHDVSEQFKAELNKLGVNVELNETLHLPHDGYAYDRSGVTANTILDTFNPDAIFDLHRDGISKSFYAVDVNGEAHSKIRIVVGKANQNQEQNLEFAVYLLSVAQEKYPWLFSDIYYGSGHYNQHLDNKALLFEMGTYLIEKEAVLNTVPKLVDTIVTTLYGSTVDNNTGDIVVGGSGNLNDQTLNDHLDDLEEEAKGSNAFVVVLFMLGIAAIGGGVYYYMFKVNHKTKNTKSKPKK